MQKLWERFFEQLMRQVRQRIVGHNVPRGAIDSEAVTVSVLESLWGCAQKGRMKNVNDRDELWWLLLWLTRRKLADHVKRATAQKRYPEKPIKSISADNSAESRFEEIVASDPSPEYVLTLEEEYQRLLNLLRDDLQRQIAVMKIEGRTNQAICEELEIATATVTRKLRVIRETWQRELEG